MLEFLNVFFHVIHITVILINTTFWMSGKTLKIAQWMLFLTVLSWFGFGIFYGLGYCFLTDWHWQIKERLGEKDLPLSYIKYVLDELTNRDWDPALIDQATMLVLVLSISGCSIQTYRHSKTRRS